MGSLIEDLLLKAAELQASDLHISDGGPAAVRIGGVLSRLAERLPADFMKTYLERLGDGDYLGRASAFSYSVAEQQSLFSEREHKVYALFEPILPEKSRIALRDKGECDFAWALASGQRFRINLYRSAEGLAAAVRIVPREIPDCDGLGLPETVRKLAQLRRGLVLLTGATGSGKSTTLAAVINEINRSRAAHILTLEDPVEYRFIPDKSLIHQREVGQDTNSFVSGLRAALREDPDVIAVGELRDLETISIAVTAAETGHLVFATLHTRGAAETVNRVIDVFPEQQQQQVRIQLAGSLQVVVSQQLLPDGHGGRVAAFEIMTVTPALRNLIREGRTQQMESYIQTGTRYGMQTMEAAVEKLKREGKIFVKNEN